jgi:AcrR family transcriptional regulator
MTGHTIGAREAASDGEGLDTRTRLKLAARRLFALHGVELVSVRDIVAAAGQRNVGSLNYYFGSKEALVHELALDAMRGIDAERNRKLDEVEAAGGPTSVREVLYLLTRFVYEPEASGSDDDTLMRFITMLILNQRDVFLEAMNKMADRGYWRCAAHIERLLPQVPAPLMKQRLLLMPLYMAAALSTREAARDSSRSWAEFWRSPATMDNLIDTAVGLLSQPPSPETLRLLADEA